MVFKVRIFFRVTRYIRTSYRGSWTKFGGANIHCVTGPCWKDFQSQRSKLVKDQGHCKTLLRRRLTYRRWTSSLIIYLFYALLFYRIRATSDRELNSFLSNDFLCHHNYIGVTNLWSEYWRIESKTSPALPGLLVARRWRARYIASLACFSDRDLKAAITGRVPAENRTLRSSTS